MRQRLVMGGVDCRRFFARPCSPTRGEPLGWRDARFERVRLPNLNLCRRVCRLEAVPYTQAERVSAAGLSETFGELSEMERGGIGCGEKAGRSGDDAATELEERCEETRLAWEARPCLVLICLAALK
jgi:hypothetical protein